MGVESLEFSSPTQAPLAGTHISYEVDRQVQLDCVTVELGKFQWDSPVELDLQQADDVFTFNLALSPRPPRAKISPLDQDEQRELESIGRVLLLYPGEKFRLSVPSGQVRSLYCGIERAGLERLVGTLDNFNERCAGVAEKLNAQTVELLLNRMYEELRDARFGWEHAIEAYAEALCIELARAIRAGSSEASVHHKGGLAPGRMRLLMDRIHAEAPAPHLGELADLCGMTVRQLSRAFKQETGKTLGKYIDEIVIERAFKMLTESHLPVCEIAVALGYSTPASFTYSFRRSTGLTPSELRRRGG